MLLQLSASWGNGVTVTYIMRWRIAVTRQCYYYSYVHDRPTYFTWSAVMEAASWEGNTIIVTCMTSVCTGAITWSTHGNASRPWDNNMTAVTCITSFGPPGACQRKQHHDDNTLIDSYLRGQKVHSLTLLEYHTSTVTFPQKFQLKGEGSRTEPTAIRGLSRDINRRVGSYSGHKFVLDWPRQQQRDIVSHLGPIIDFHFTNAHAG